MIIIKHRFTDAELYRHETATTISGALQLAAEAGANLRGAYLKGADLKGANLRGADLKGADLRGADLEGAYLRGADLEGAYLEGAYLEGAYLEGAYLRGANLRGAYLRGANLRGADLEGAYLEGAYLRGADLEGANLRGAYLDSVKADVHAILTLQPNEVPGLLAALEEGRVDGSTYDGPCACLVGTIANVAGCQYNELVVRPDSERPAEIWFLGIRKGDTPATNQMSALAVQWVEEWLASKRLGS